jgi:colanic acid/amylovoran biosynthesis glycosyltransferase
VGELGVQQSVRLVGAKANAEVIDLLASHHLFVAPSVTAASGDREGIPNVLKEAMATGMPVVSTRHSGIPELVEDGVSGYLVSERDVGALASRLRDLVEHPERWPAMGRAGRTRVENGFASQRLNERLFQLYERAARRDEGTQRAAREPVPELGA